MKSKKRNPSIDMSLVIRVCISFVNIKVLKDLGAIDMVMEDVSGQNE